MSRLAFHLKVIPLSYVEKIVAFCNLEFVLYTFFIDDCDIDSVQILPLVTVFGMNIQILTLRRAWGG